MRVASWVLPTLLSTVLVAGLLPHGGAAQTQGSEWADIQGIAVGDHWSYRVSGQDNGDVHNEVVSAGPKTNKFGATHDSYRIHASGELKSKQRPSALAGTPLRSAEQEVTLYVEVDKWVRKDDYAVVQLEGETHVQSRSGTTKTDVTESYKPALVEVVFPFTVGYKWRTGAYWEVQRGSEPESGDLEFLYEVIKLENITVPAGTFQAWKVKITGGQHPDTFKYQWYSEEVCDLVKEERYKVDDGEGTLINTMVLTDWSCSRTEKANPTYDPDWVQLVTTGGKVPPLDGFDKDAHDPQTHANTAPDGGYTTLLLLAAALVAATASGMLVRYVRR